jgi:hypothetical protein
MQPLLRQWDSWRTVDYSRSRWQVKERPNIKNYFLNQITYPEIKPGDIAWLESVHNQYYLPNHVSRELIVPAVY